MGMKLVQQGERGGSGVSGWGVWTAEVEETRPEGWSGSGQVVKGLE